ncbi:MAG: NADH-quinone oxidoreductase subunit C [Desulfobulbus sp.]|nr:NADH-quinone oxidoreductase subunit C [Desulfobulbus sp.]
MALQETTLQALQELFPGGAFSAQEELNNAPGIRVTDPAKHGHHLEVLCPAEQVVALAELMDRDGYFLESISGVDWLEQQQLEVVYDYNRLGGEHCRVMVRTRIPRDNPEVPTITGVYPSANWHERETFDFYGVIFLDHPNLIRILLPEDADFFPLRKDYLP